MIRTGFDIWIEIEEYGKQGTAVVAMEKWVHLDSLKTKIKNMENTTTKHDNYTLGYLRGLNNVLSLLEEK